MPISFGCSCGKRFSVPDEHAGKKTKCPACKAPLAVPTPAPVPAAKPAADEDPGFEVLDDEPPAAETVEFEVVEAPTAKKPPVKAVVAEAAEEPPAEAPKKPKKKKRKRPDDDEDGVAAEYMAEARAKMRAEEHAVAGNDGGGRTLFGITVTGGVLAGLGMLLSGFVIIVLLMMFQESWGLRGTRAFVYAIAYTILGVLTLVKAIVFGEED